MMRTLSARPLAPRIPLAALSLLDAPKRQDRKAPFPAFDVVEGEGEIRLLADVPGVRREELEIEVEDRRLVVRGQRTRPEGEHRLHLAERSYGPFQRSFLLPQEVALEEVRAEYENGVLTIRVPKMKPERRRIEVQG